MDAISDPALHQLLNSARSADSARSRAGFGSLHRHRADDASLVGLLVNLAECNAFVSLSTRSGTERRGRIINAGSGGIVLLTSSTTRSLIRLSAIASVRSAARLRLDGDGSPHESTSWPTLLASHADHGDDLSLSSNNQFVFGTVRSLSRSLLILDTPDGGVFYAVVDAIDELSISVPGSIRHD